MKLFRLYAFALFAVLLFAQEASAQQQHIFLDIGKKLDAVACNASASARRFTLAAGQGAGFGLAAFQIDFTRGTSATAVTMQCEVSLNNGTTWAVAQDCSVSVGTCTSSDATWSKTTSVSANWLWRNDFIGASDVRCTVSCTAGGAGDLITLYGRLSTL